MIVLLVIVLIVILSSIKQINEYERGILFSYGKFNKVLNPGWRLVLPIIQSYSKIDIRTKVIDVPEQETITKDNVSVRINAVIYFSVFDAGKALLQVENFLADKYHFLGDESIAKKYMLHVMGTLSKLCEEAED